MNEKRERRSEKRYWRIAFIVRMVCERKECYFKEIAKELKEASPTRIYEIIKEDLPLHAPYIDIIHDKTEKGNPIILRYNQKKKDRIDQEHRRRKKLRERVAQMRLINQLVQEGRNRKEVTKAIRVLSAH